MIYFHRDFTLLCVLLRKKMTFSVPGVGGGAGAGLGGAGVGTGGLGGAGLGGGYSAAAKAAKYGKMFTVIKVNSLLRFSAVLTSIKCSINRSINTD